jgi:hypothetical protein
VGGEVTVTVAVTWVEDEEQAVSKIVRMGNRIFFMGKFL